MGDHKKWRLFQIAGEIFWNCGGWFPKPSVGGLKWFHMHQNENVHFTAHSQHNRIYMNVCVDMCTAGKTIFRRATSMGLHGQQNGRSNQFIASGGAPSRSGAL